MIEISSFPNSLRLGHLSEERRARLLSTCYAFYALSHNKRGFSDNPIKVNAHILGSFPVWKATEERANSTSVYSFERTIGSRKYFFYRTQTEFAAIQFCSQDNNKVVNDAAIFAHLNYERGHEGSLLSTFNVPIKLLAQIDLALAETGAFPRFLMVHGTGKTGLLLTTNHENHRARREHMVYALPDLSIGKASKPEDRLEESKFSLSDFVISCNYPMETESGRSEEI